MSRLALDTLEISRRLQRGAGMARSEADLNAHAIFYAYVNAAMKDDPEGAERALERVGSETVRTILSRSRTDWKEFEQVLRKLHGDDDAV